jgi:effector-binding domain-containing protein/ribosome-associated toxin RatA of RatAB toxin-antitoxin module
MRFVKIFLIVVIVLIAGFSIWNATLPASYDFSRSIVINAPAEYAFEQVNEVKNWEQWSPWAAMDNTAEFTYHDQTVGTGAWYSWNGDTVGVGKLTIVESEPNSHIKTKLEFTEPNQVLSAGYWTFEEDNGVTTVTWGNTGELPFFMRFIGSMMDQQMGNAFESGLENLKEIAESRAMRGAENTLQNGQIDVMDFGGGAYLGMRFTELSWADMDKAFSEGFSSVFNALGADANNVTGPPFGLIELWDEENQITTVVTGVPVETEIEVNPPLEKGQLYSGKVIRYTYFGDFSGTGTGHYAIEEYANANGLTLAGAPWESYVTDTETEPDTSKWLTFIYYPVEN